MTDEHEHREFLKFWTSEGADSVRAAAAELIAAVTEHSEAVSAAEGEADVPGVFAANGRLLEVAVAYSSAQIEHTGIGFPFSALAQYLEEDTGEEEQYEAAAADALSGVSVLMRRDYEVVDHDAVIRAGCA